MIQRILGIEAKQSSLLIGCSGESSFPLFEYRRAHIIISEVGVPAYPVR